MKAADWIGWRRHKKNRKTYPIITSSTKNLKLETKTSFHSKLQGFMIV